MAKEPPEEMSCECKIGRDIERYYLNELNETLVEYRQEHEVSLRDLATYINHQILEAAVEDTADNMFNEESSLFGALEREDAVAAIYGALSDNDVAPDRRARVRTRLKQAGVDLNSVEDDFVTHTTVRRHLNECLGIDTSSEQTIDSENAKNTIEWVRTRCAAIVERTFKRLQSAEQLNAQNLDISVSIKATCTECGATFPPSEFISRGHCDCYSGVDSG